MHAGAWDARGGGGGGNEHTRVFLMHMCKFAAIISYNKKTSKNMTVRKIIFMETIGV